MTRIELPQVTLCCVDTTARLPWALRAIRRSMAHIDFGDVVLCTDAASAATHELPAGVRWSEIEPLRGIEAYSHFMLKGLLQHVHTSHVLIIQWDGFVLHPNAWRDEFLAFDYLGAPWNDYPEPWSVGNGGFSLRSRALLEALQDSALEAMHPEDICICQTHRAALEAKGIRFAPRELAQYFSVEDGELTAEILGFHSPCHLPAILEPDAAKEFLDSLDASLIRAHYFGSLLRELVKHARHRPDLEKALARHRQMIRGAVQGLHGEQALTPQALGACKAMIRYGEYPAAETLLRHRRRALGSRWAEPKLWWRMKVKSWLARLTSMSRDGA
ncbi:MAG: hypothetical protein RLZZ618_4209 [Pseudomonadota bacterium]|jgi:hypothetical protein